MKKILLLTALLGGTYVSFAGTKEIAPLEIAPASEMTTMVGIAAGIDVIGCIIAAELVYQDMEVDGYSPEVIDYYRDIEQQRCQDGSHSYYN